MRVPAPVSARRDSQFERELDGALTRAERTRSNERDAERAADLAAPPRPDEPPAEPTPAAEAEARDADAGPAPTTDPVVTGRPAAVVTQQELEAKDPVRRAAAGKETGSFVSSPVAADTTPARAPVAGVPVPALLGRANASAEAPAVAPVNAATAAAPAAATATLRGVPGEAKLAAERAKGPAPVAAPRAPSPAHFQLAEQARDSMFKQIAMRLGDGGGEMRVLLDPPELGELELRLLVDERGSMRLSIWAERAETSLALEKHLHELRQTLAHSGVSIAHAEVHSDRDRQPGARDGFELPAPSPLAAVDADADETTLSSHGWWTADGLELWV